MGEKPEIMRDHSPESIARSQEYLGRPLREGHTPEKGGPLAAGRSPQAPQKRRPGSRIHLPAFFGAWILSGWNTAIMLMREEVVQAMENIPESAIMTVIVSHDPGSSSSP